MINIMIIPIELKYVVMRIQFIIQQKIILILNFPNQITYNEDEIKTTKNRQDLLTLLEKIHNDDSEIIRTLYGEELKITTIDKLKKELKTTINIEHTIRNSKF